MAIIRRRNMLALGLGGVLGGCGFRPVYAPATSRSVGPAASELAAIEVAIIPDRNGQVLRQDIQERLERFGIQAAKKYKLSVSYAVSQDSLGIQPDSSATYLRVIGTANWTLLDIDKPRLITTGSAKSVTSLNTIDQQIFAQELETTSVTTKMAQDLADQISLRLAMYFNEQAAGKPA